MQHGGVAPPVQPRRPPAAPPLGASGVDDESEGAGQLAVEVRRLQRPAPHDLVHPAQLCDRELLGAELRRQRRVLELGAGAFDGVVEDLAVVERESLALQLLDRPPGGRSRVRTGLGFGQAGYDGEVSDADRSRTWTPTRPPAPTTSALGYGLGYDERLLAAIGRGGQGNELFAEDADRAGALIAGEVSGLLSQTIQAASLTIRMSPHVRAVRLANDLPRSHRSPTACWSSSRASRLGKRASCCSPSTFRGCPRSVGPRWPPSSCAASTWRT